MTAERSVLVPLDGSGLGGRTDATAADLADRLGVGLLLLSVIPPFSPASVRFRTEQYLQYVLERTHTERPPETCIAEGVPDEQILDMARSSRAAMVVMSTHGRSASARTFLGGVTSSVLRAASVPVLVMNPAVLPMPWEKLTGRRVVIVPLDGSEFAERAIPVARQMAAAYGARIALVRVVPAYDGPAVPGEQRPPDDHIAAQFTRARRESDAYLDALARPIPAEVTVHSSIGVPTEAVMRMTRSEADAIVVIATRGISHAYADSPTGVVDALVQRARVPTVVLPAHAEAGMAPVLAGHYAGRTESICTSA